VPWPSRLDVHRQTTRSLADERVPGLGTTPQGQMRLVAVRDDQSTTGTSRHAQHSVQMLISDWLIIDGTMDNHAQSSIDGAVPDDMDEEDGRFSESPAWDAGEEMSRLPRTARLAMSIRRAGWDQIPGWPHDVEGFKTWPATGQMAMVTLADAQWKLVVFAVGDG